MCRKLTALGATLVFLGHAKKYRDKLTGNLIPDGVGDVTTDSDDLLFLEHTAAIDGIDVTTVVDQDKGAKVRGIFKSISFNISEKRDITLLSHDISIPDRTRTRSMYVDEDDIIQATVNVLTDTSGPMKKMDLAAQVQQNVQGKAGIERVRKIISRQCEGAGPFKLTKGSDGNTHMITLRPVKVEIAPIEAKLKEDLPSDVKEEKDHLKELPGDLI